MNDNAVCGNNLCRGPRAECLRCVVVDGYENLDVPVHARVSEVTAWAKSNALDAQVWWVVVVQ